MGFNSAFKGLNWSSRKRMWVYMGLVWHRIRTCGEILWTQEGTFSFHTVIKISWLADGLSASQEWLCFKESVRIDVQKGLQLVLYSCVFKNRFQCPRGIRRGSAAARLLGLWVRIPPRACMPVSFEYCFLSGRGICVGLITRPEEPYMSVLCPTYRKGEASIMWRPRSSRGCCGLRNKNISQL